MGLIKITEDCIIDNDMPYGWAKGKNQPSWHGVIYDRWYNMWDRCNNPKNKSYSTYKNIPIDERYRSLSNYSNDIQLLENFDKLKLNPNDYEIDKDIKGSLGYYFDNLSIVPKSMNRKERVDRLGSPGIYTRKPVKATHKNNGTILIFEYINQALDYGFDDTCISNCLHGRQKTHNGYYWEYLEEGEEYANY